MSFRTGASHRIGRTHARRAFGTVPQAAFGASSQELQLMWSILRTVVELRSMQLPGLSVPHTGPLPNICQQDLTPTDLKGALPSHKNYCTDNLRVLLDRNRKQFKVKVYNIAIVPHIDYRYLYIPMVGVSSSHPTSNPKLCHVMASGRPLRRHQRLSKSAVAHGPRAQPRGSAAAGGKLLGSNRSMTWW